jgi:hypothetical protein
MESESSIRRTTLNKTREDILEEIDIAEDRIRRYNRYIINSNREIEEKKQEINNLILPPKRVRRYKLEIEKKEESIRNFRRNIETEKTRIKKLSESIKPVKSANATKLNRQRSRSRSRSRSGSPRTSKSKKGGKKRRKTKRKRSSRRSSRKY